MRVFITGATGFAGAHLIKGLLEEGAQVSALVHGPTSRYELPAEVISIDGNLLDEDVVSTAVTRTKPDLIFHLAGQAYPAKSWEIPGQTIAVNTVGTANLLQAAAVYGLARVVVVTSADMYGLIRDEDLPITEETAVHPRHPYGVSKWAAGQLVPLYWQRFGLEVVEARPFNHIGPGQGLGFVVPDFALQIAKIKKGLQQNSIKVGNLEAKRDFTDVRDVVRAYRLLAEKGRAGEAYLICSGQAVSIQSLLNTLVALAEVSLNIERDETRMRPSDIPCLYASYEKIKQDTGWQPVVDLRQSLADALADWMTRI